MSHLLQSYIPEIYMGLSSLLVHKLRTMLTMMGMIFGVGAVVAMLAITAGVEKEMLSYIDMLGVNNIIIEAKEAVDRNELQARRAISPGLTFRDFRAIKENTQGIELATPRKRFKPAKVIPKTAAEPPVLIGVEPAYEQIQSIRVVEGRFFTAEEDAQSAPVCVLGESAKVNLLGYEPAVGKYVKLNEVWLQVIGVMAQQAGADTDVEGVEILSRNNLVVAPLNTVMRRFEDGNSYLKDEIDGIYMRVVPGTDSIEVAGVVTAILTATHKDAGDFTVTVPAGLLEQKKRTSDIFKVVMICIAGISLLVGGIGIMNIMLATVLERTREIGIRRAIGARQKDIIRQFLTEAVMISIIGGLIGILFGFTLSRVIAAAAGWSTVVTFASIAVAFGVSVGIGLLFGIYPAVQAAKLDPIEAIRYE
ncbi:MAG: ABC transporter permease [Bryobacteraceae bacterium]|nr:ABC transporter permease [Bryobacteraceae bacterium]HRJ18823.1 ABC transporter permease [Bryobacteraceae bacterium]